MFMKRSSNMNQGKEWVMTKRFEDSKLHLLEERSLIRTVFKISFRKRTGISRKSEARREHRKIWSQERDFSTKHKTHH